MVLEVWVQFLCRETSVHLTTWAGETPLVQTDAVLWSMTKVYLWDPLGIPFQAFEALDWMIPY